MDFASLFTRSEPVLEDEGGIVRLIRGSVAIVLVMLAALMVATGLAGAGVLYALPWELFGKEKLTVRPGILALRREILGSGRQRAYDLQSVRNLRLSPPHWDTQGWRSPFRSSGVLAFDYGAETVRFGSAIEEGEASIILSQIAKHPVLSEQMPAA